MSTINDRDEMEFIVAVKLVALMEAGWWHNRTVSVKHLVI